MNDYSDSLNIQYNRQPLAPWSFVSSRDTSLRIAITPITNGTEKQNEYANNLKLQALRRIDETAANLISRGAMLDRTIDFRNRLMVAVDAESDARHTIDALKSIACDTQLMARHYNVMP